MICLPRIKSKIFASCACFTILATAVLIRPETSHITNSSLQNRAKQILAIPEESIIPTYNSIPNKHAIFSAAFLPSSKPPKYGYVLIHQWGLLSLTDHQIKQICEALTQDILSLTKDRSQKPRPWLCIFRKLTVLKSLKHGSDYFKKAHSAICLIPPDQIIQEDLMYEAQCGDKNPQHILKNYIKNIYVS